MANNLVEGNFRIVTVIDDDGHLSIYVGSLDGSPVLDIGEDIGNEGVFGVRLTTAAIEAAYSARP